MPHNTYEFSDALMDFINVWKSKPGNLIMLLHRVQEEFGFIPRSAAERLARILQLPLAKIYGVITFYHYFKTTKPGRERISVCLGTACYLKGSQDIANEARSILGIQGDEVTDDGQFSIDEVRCLGCCGLAPVAAINDEIYGSLTKDKLPEIIARHRVSTKTTEHVVEEDESAWGE